MKKLCVSLLLITSIFIIEAKLRIRSSTHGGRVAQASYGRLDYNCCPDRRPYQLPKTEAGAVAEVRKLRNELWNELDNGTYQASLFNRQGWMYKQRRIRQIETRLGYIVDWPD